MQQRHAQPESAGRTGFDRAKVIAHDLLMAGASLMVAMYLRLGSDMFTDDFALLVEAVPLFMMVAGVIFYAFGMYRGVWRYASVADLAVVVKAVTLAILLFMTLLFFIDRDAQLPRSVPVIQWFVLVIMVTAPRLSCRLVRRAVASDWTIRWRTLHDLAPLATRWLAGADPAVPVLVVGVSDRAALFIHAMNEADAATCRVVGILDEMPGHRGRSVGGVPVLGRIADLPRVVARLEARGLRPERIILADRLAGERLRPLVEQAERTGLRVARVTQIADEPGGDGRVELRPLALEDLLGRPQVTLDRSAISALVAGRRILVTGAGGSIGSELAQQIAELRPARLLLADASEFNLYTIAQRIRERHPLLDAEAALVDVRDHERIEALFADHRPELVFHAAALKHVPMVEAHPCEGVQTNVVGTRNVADAAYRHRALAMVLISTDKAVNPTSMMGATKRLAEFYCQALDHHGRTDVDGRAPRLITVRFGNVLGSSGSVVPLFRRQLAEGGPLTVTHPDIRRYFMTLQEAVELVLQASAHGAAHPEERGRIYVLDMGEPIRVVDIARQLARLHGKRPDVDVRIDYIGLRPGEKLDEELFDVEEAKGAPVADGVLAALSQARDLQLLRSLYEALGSAARHGDRATLARLVSFVLPSYQPWSPGRDEAPAQESPPVPAPAQAPFLEAKSAGLLLKGAPAAAAAAAILSSPVQ